MRFSNLFVRVCPAITQHLSVNTPIRSLLPRISFHIMITPRLPNLPYRPFCLSLGSTTWYPDHVLGAPARELLLTDISCKFPAFYQAKFSLEFTRETESFKY